MDLYAPRLCVANDSDDDDDGDGGGGGGGGQRSSRAVAVRLHRELLLT